MSNKAKQKGSAFEAEVVKLLEKTINNSTWKRIPGSGAIGTSMDEPLLTGDITGRVEGFPRTFKVECKTGYNNSSNKEVKQFTLKKEWMDKIAEEAAQTNGFPILVGHFSGARSGVKNFVVLDAPAFAALINYITKLNEDLYNEK